MAKDDLSIQILAKLNENLSEDTIKKQLEKIQKNLNINIGIDSNQMQSISAKVDHLQKQVSGKQIKIVDENNAKIFFKTINDVINKYSSLGSINISKSINPATQEMEKFLLTVTKTDGTVQKLNFELAKLGNIHGVDGFYLKSQNIVDKTADIQEKRLREEENINYTIKQQNDNLKHQLEMFKQRSVIDSNNLSRRYNGKFDDTALKEWEKSVDALSLKTPNLRQEMDRLGLGFKKISSEVRSSQSHVLSFGESLRVALEKFPINLPGGIKTSLIAGTPLEPFKLQRKDEINLNVNV